MKDNKESYQLLNNIDIPKDLRSLSEDKLPEVCQEIRQEIIDVCSHNPGHLASSLGAVELAVALHYVFDTPEDKIIWDVGHQAYAVLFHRHWKVNAMSILVVMRPTPFQ